MKLIQKTKGLLGRFGIGAGLDEAEVSIFGINAKLVRKIPLPVPHEVSIFIPRLEISQKTTEGSKSTETTMVLSSLTIVSAPRHEPLEPDRKISGADLRSETDRGCLR